MSMHHVRIVLGSLSLVLFAHSAFWLLYDVVGQGVPEVWSVWTKGPASGLAATSSVDLGLAALQLAAACATLLRVRGAGGLLLTVCATTLAFRAPVVWYWLLDSPSDPWFGGLDGPSLTAVGTTCLLALLIVLVQAALLLRVRRLEHEAAAREAALAGGVRPVKVTAAASCVLLAVLNCFYIARNALTAFDIGPDALGDLLAGKGAGHAVLGVSSPWQWACLTVLCGVGMVLAGRRRPSATGFSLGLALFMMPTAFTKLWGSADADTLLASPLGTLQSFLELVGSAAVVALIVADVRDDLRPAPADPALPEPSPEQEADQTPVPEPERTREPASEPEDTTSRAEPDDAASPAGTDDTTSPAEADEEAGADDDATADAQPTGAVRQA
ncbi:hypothetical protein [Streptomyces sp. NPDC014676]|uniref:hypothetical protein n=1 Tax=Streptomyces sp. NPDC014676 TaxID=3364879 RepID=UPI0036FA051D